MTTGLAVDQIEARADLHLAGDAHLALVAGRQELGADEGRQQQAGGEQRSGAEHRHQALAQHPFKQVAVAVFEPRQPAPARAASCAPQPPDLASGAAASSREASMGTRLSATSSEQTSENMIT